MKVMGINGSSRADGNTFILINTVFGELRKEGIGTEMIQLLIKTSVLAQAADRVAAEAV